MTNDPRTGNGFEQDKPGTAARDRAESAIEELRQRGGIFVEAVRATRMAMALTDPALPGNPIVFANQSFLNLSGYSMAEVLGQQPYFMNGPQTDPEDAARFRQILESDQDGVVETVQYAKNGRRFVATVLLSAFKDEDERTLHHFLSWADVTRRVDAEDEAAHLRKTQAALQLERQQQKLLLSELQHRTRNTLAVVRSIVRRTAAGSATVEEFERHLDGRLGAFARTQAYVTRNLEGGIDLELMVLDELLAHAADGSQHISIEGPPVRLAANVAETISLAIHELTTNAIKHGALRSDRNQLCIVWSLGGTGNDRTLHFSWMEQLADSKLEPPERNGFGTELLDRVMRYELDAEPEIAFKPSGFEYRVAIRLPAGAAKSLT